MLVNHILLDLWNGERCHYLHMPFPFHNTVLIKTWHQLSLLPLGLMFIVGNTRAKMPQKAGSCSGQEVFKSSYFATKGWNPASSTREHYQYLDLSPLLHVSLGTHMLVRACRMFAERGGEPEEVFSQTGIDLPRVFLWLLQLPLVLIPLGRMVAGINCTTSWGCEGGLEWQGQGNEDGPWGICGKNVSLSWCE